MDESKSSRDPDVRRSEVGGLDVILSLALKAMRFFLILAGFTHRLLSSAFLGLPYRILTMNHKKELLRSLWVGFRVFLVVLGCKFPIPGFLHLELQVQDSGP